VRFELYSGAGNRFLLLESKEADFDWPLTARRLCARTLFGGKQPDGLLVLTWEADGGARMRIYNADGSRPEACGNGLRCAGLHLARRLDQETVTLRTDAGERRIEMRRQAGEVATLYADMGVVTVGPLSEPWPELAGLHDAYRVDVGNPHCVLRVEDERSEELERIGRLLQISPEFPEGVNVGFLAGREDLWRLRVWERGVGETEACGTGACAAAAVIGGEEKEVLIRMRGGDLTLRRGPGTHYHLLGEARHHGSVELAVDMVATTPLARAEADPT
jgi:diaminopimelate epimerase